MSTILAKKDILGRLHRSNFNLFKRIQETLGKPEDRNFEDVEDPQGLKVRMIERGIKIKSTSIVILENISLTDDDLYERTYTFPIDPYPYGTKSSQKTLSHVNSLIDHDYDLRKNRCLCLITYQFSLLKENNNIRKVYGSYMNKKQISLTFDEIDDVESFESHIVDLLDFTGSITHVHDEFQHYFKVEFYLNYAVKVKPLRSGVKVWQSRKRKKKRKPSRKSGRRKRDNR
jgi:hypothetical protein